MKLFFLLRSVQFEFLSDLYGTYPKGTSLVLDYNFYSMICILGIVTCAFVLIKERSKMHSVLLQLLVFGLILDVMFSTSRRGIVALSFILLILFLILLFGRLAGKGKWMSILSEKLRLVFLFLFSFIFLLIFFLSQNPFKSTNTMHSKSGFEQSAGSNIIHVCVRRYFTILNPGTDAYFGGIIKDPDNRFSGGRVQRIKYGIKIFSQDYSTSKKIIGGGFDYLWDFGKEFYSKNNHRFYFDYPHNPILSALLYSGIAGGLSLVYFFFMTFLNFYRSFRSLFYYICLYVIIFSFAFFSGNSIFGCPEFVLISLFPFYFTIIKYKGHREARSAIA
jgi:O-antigen ligase